MQPFQRPEVPDFLLEHGEKWGKQFQDRRTKNEGAKFQWPTYQGQPINREIEKRLGAATQFRCSYCDDWPLGEREDSIDHFRPKSDPRFRHLVCQWDNLYYACGNCQSFKGEQWSDNPQLIAPDEEGYAFNRFFIIDARTWKIEPNPAASPMDKKRAEYTISTLGLWDDKHIKGRRHHAERYYLMLDNGLSANLNDFAYRYLFT
jgi:uncharacterized protein (TIGR02646 family)